MRYLVLASDYDGTLATGGKVDDTTLQAVDRLLKSGRKFLLVTGRELEDLKQVFPAIDRCDLVVAENGGVIYNPATRGERFLAEPPNAEFLEELSRRGVPFTVGRGVVATWEPHQAAVFEAIQKLGLELQVSFNKGAVMVLPSGVNKLSGLNAALGELRLSPHNVVGIGDAENDHVFLTGCECGVAVANALPSLKERADLVTEGDHGAGVAEIIERLIEDDLRQFDGHLKRHEIVLGNRPDGAAFKVASQRGSLLFAGPSGSGKSTAATGVLEALADRQYQFCLLDPEGDYENFMGALQFGSPRTPPEIKQILIALDDPQENVVVNLLGVAMEDRPLFFSSLLAQLLDLRTRTARPHWIVVDEAHHMLPSSWASSAGSMPETIGGMIFITVHPEMMARSALECVEVAVAVGQEAGATLAGFAKVISKLAPKVANWTLQPGEGMVWRPRNDEDPFSIKLCLGKTERTRHLRKYAQGELGEDRSFYFRGPEGKLNLRAQNLQTFNAIAEGIDDDTWLFHLRNHDYSRWFREAIKDGDLAEEAVGIEGKQAGNAGSSRAAIKAAIDSRYTAAA